MNQERKRERDRRYRERNVDRVRETKRRWQAANLEKAREANRRHRARHPERHREQTRRYRQRNAAIIVAAKDVPCADCGNRFPPPAMDFDHKGSEKVADISRMHHYGLEKLYAEIAKCDVVCANCHRLRHHGG